MLGLIAAGCGGSASGSQSSPASQPATAAAPPPSGPVKIVMKTLAFEPAATHARVGQTVQWTNEDNVFHNVIYVNGPKFKSSPPHLRNGESYSIVPTQAGTINYFCSIHPWMKGSIVVTK